MVPNFFHLRMMEVTVFLGTVNAAEMFWYSSPDLCFETILSPNAVSHPCLFRYGIYFSKIYWLKVDQSRYNLKVNALGWQRTASFATEGGLIRSLNLFLLILIEH